MDILQVTVLLFARSLMPGRVAIYRTWLSAVD